MKNPKRAPVTDGNKIHVEIFPQVTRKPLGDCEAGELVRVKWGGEQTFALVVTDDGQQFLVFLPVDDGEQMPKIVSLERPDISAVCYGRSYRIEVDQDARHVDLTGQHLWDKSGALVVAGDHYLMHVKASRESRRLVGSLYLRLETGTLAPEPVGRVAIFGKWSLILPKGGDRYETLLTIG